jgi:hypothetical protein
VESKKKKIDLIEAENRMVVTRGWGKERRDEEKLINEY